MSTLTQRRILLIASFFPPAAPLGTTRAPALARYWLARGHDVRVLAARDPRYPSILESGVPDERVTFVPFPEISGLRDTCRLLRRLRELDAPDSAAASPDTPVRAGAMPPAHTAAINESWWKTNRVWRWLADQNKRAVYFPDRHLGWVEPAIAAGSALIRTHRPDFIFATGRPHSSLIVGRHLAARHKLPWFAELRDLWANDPFASRIDPFALADRWLETPTLREASGLVAVTRSAADLLHTRYHLPTAVIYNGFEDGYVPGPDPAQTNVLGPAGPGLKLVYTGTTYGQRRVPHALFEALAMLGPEAEGIELHYFGEDFPLLVLSADKFAVTRHLVDHGITPHTTALAAQREADVLLLSLWDHPRQDGVIPGKLFEYIGNRKPILCLGRTSTEAATIIAEGPYGVTALDPSAVAGLLRRWLEEKRRAGRLSAPDGQDAQRYSRRSQFETLDSFLAGLLKDGSALPAEAPARP